MKELHIIRKHTGHLVRVGRSAAKISWVSGSNSPFIEWLHWTRKGEPVFFNVAMRKSEWLPLLCFASYSQGKTRPRRLNSV